MSETRFVAPLKQMANALMTTVKALGIAAIQPLHPDPEIGFRRFDKQVIMVTHQAIGVALPPLLVDLASQALKKGLAVLSLETDILLGIASGRQLLEGSRKHEAQGA